MTHSLASTAPVAVGPAEPPRVRLWIAVALGYTALGATLQLLPEDLPDRFGTETMQTAVLTGIAFVATAVVRPFAGWFGDSGHARVATAAGGGAALVGGLIQMTAPNLALLTAGRLVMGAGEALLFSAAIPWALRGVGPGQRGRVAGRFGLSMWTGLTVGPVVATATHALGGGTATWWLVLITSAISAAVSLSTPRDGRTAASPSISSLQWSRLVPSGSRLPGVYLGAAGYAYGTVVTLTVAYLATRGFPTALGLPVFAGCFLATRAVGSPFVDRLGPSRVGGALAVLEGAALFALPTTSQAAVTIAIVGLAGVGVALAYPCAAALTLGRAPTYGGGQAVGAMTSWWDLGVFASGIVGGLLAATIGFGAAFSGAAVGCLVGVVVVLALRPTLGGSR